FQDPVDIRRGRPKQFALVTSIRQQAADVRKETPRIDRGQTVASSERDNFRAIHIEETNPTVGSAACCARTASGHAAAVPPTSVMNSRRCSGRDVRFIARPPHRTVRAAFPHTAPTWVCDGKLPYAFQRL